MTETAPEQDEMHSTDERRRDRSEPMHELTHQPPTDGPTRSFERGTEGRDRTA